MARMGFVDDSEWPEVKKINDHAMFNGYLVTGVRGLGLLVIAWNTAVLLGGFVPNLTTKDFWCLTAVTLIQAAGVVDFFLKEKLTELLFQTFHKLTGLFGKIIGRNLDPEERLIILVIKMLGFLILLVILGPVLVLGLGISTGISMWRLIIHTHGNASESANLKPSLYVLYSIAVAQGVLYGYKIINANWARKRLPDSVVRLSSVDEELVLAYLESTVVGCKKDPSFAIGRNLVTYAVDLMKESKYDNFFSSEEMSNDSFVLGIRVLGQVVIKPERSRGRLVLAKHLLTRSSSFRHLMEGLLETLGPRSPYSREIREHAARIVAVVAGAIHLEQFPRGVQCVTSLLVRLETSQESNLTSRPQKEHLLQKKYRQTEYERYWLLDKYERDYIVLELEREYPRSVRDPLLDYARLVIQGLRILRKLAGDEDNYRIIINTQGLLPKIIDAPLISNQLHRDHHDQWSEIVNESLELMSWLMAAPWKTETKLQDEISSYSGAIIITVESILLCYKCSLLEKRNAIEILLLLDPFVDISSISSRCGRLFKWILLTIHLLSDKSYTRKLAGEKLEAMMPSLQSEGSSTRMLQSVGGVLDDLTRALVDAENNADRVHAAQILEHLCLNYKIDDEYLKKLKKVLVDAMEKVLQEILGLRRQVQHVPGTDLESGDVSQTHGQEGSKLQEALILLCWIIWVKWYGVDLEMTHQLDEVAEKVCLEQEKPAEKFEKLVLVARDLLKKEAPQINSRSSY